jgi:hypothetical protein
VADGTELARFLVLTGRRVFTVQSNGVDVHEEGLLQGLTRRIAALGVYQLCVCVADPPS